MGVKIDLRIITKNHAADIEKEFLKKSILKRYGHATAMPTSWELRDDDFEIEKTGGKSYYIRIHHTITHTFMKTARCLKWRLRSIRIGSTLGSQY